jgi:hypothetical protein
MGESAQRRKGLLGSALAAVVIAASLLAPTAAQANSVGIIDECTRIEYPDDWSGSTRHYVGDDGKCWSVTLSVDYGQKPYSASVRPQIDGTGWKLTVKIPSRVNQAVGGKVTVIRDGKVIKTYRVNNWQNTRNEATYALPNLSKYRSHTLKIYYRGVGTSSATLLATATVGQQLPVSRR